MTVLLIILGIIALLAVFIIGIYNRLVALRQTTNQAWSDIEVQLKQRQDLVPQLVATVKGYAKHEKSTFEEVVQARAAAMGATTVQGQAQAEGMLTAALGKMFALAEAYPELKANTNFLQLQDQLSDVENKIAAARRFYNNSVQEYNTGREQFPAVLIAGPFGFREREFFEAPEGREVLQTAPEINFD
ncbi:membrane protein [Litorimonas cladophorae]|jgi:LemA protein|uniref:Membrane protein n=1 Tax=Litorimonas cladophorae TaxID=1220491 RepID=A0A918KE22_9PROT|nr:LemA family protein [Litorimonas cladophorae]GGX59702.1 membrane protein [Litorimonas cladophorae]